MQAVHIAERSCRNVHTALASAPPPTQLCGSLTADPGTPQHRTGNLMPRKAKQYIKIVTDYTLILIQFVILPVFLTAGLSHQSDHYHKQHNFNSICHLATFSRCKVKSPERSLP